MVVQLSGVLDRQFGGGVKWPTLHWKVYAIMICKEFKGK